MDIRTMLAAAMIPFVIGTSNFVAPHQAIAEVPAERNPQIVQQAKKPQKQLQRQKPKVKHRQPRLQQKQRQPYHHDAKRNQVQPNHR
ncbi:hypothetical protein [Anabaena azotica]|uniref:hypothetical protein n=1 Tax=Anabaena azotica TaxID=197653 RepID=UPI0039A5B443